MLATRIQTKQDLVDALLIHGAAIKSYGVNRLGIFGSFSKGTNTDDSDIDLLVEFDPAKKSYDNFMDLSFFLEEHLGRKVEIVTPQSMSEFIGPHILKEVYHVSL